MSAKFQAMACSAGSDQLDQAQWAARAFPDDPFLLANLGIVQFKLGRAKDSLVTLQGAVRLNEREPQLRYLLSFALNANARPEEAHEQLDYGHASDPVGWRKWTQHFENKSMSPCSPASSNAMAESHGETNSGANTETNTTPQTEVSHKHRPGSHRSKQRAHRNQESNLAI